MQKLVFTNGSGQSIDLTSGNFGITNWEGLSGVGLNIQTQQVPFQDGGVFLDALMEQREISVTVAIQDNNDLSLRYELKRQLISALNPKLGEGVLVYTNDYLARQIKAVPQLPIFENKNSNDAGTLKASVVFSCPSPYWEDLENTVVSLSNGVRTNVANSGDVPCGVKVEMTTGNTVNPFIRNFTQEKKVGIKGSYLTNVQIDTEVGKKSVTIQDMTFKQSMGSFSVKAFAYSSEKGLIVGVGTYNGICVSGNGEDWRVVNTPVGYNQNLNGVCYSLILNKFIAVGGEIGIGIIYSSTDGVNWEVETDQIANMLNDVFYSEELDLFIAVGNAGIIIKSADGTTWTDLTSGVSVNLNKMCYAKNLGLFVVVGRNGTILTSEDLTTWSAQTSGISIEILCITYSEELNLFIAGTLNNYLTSTDGINWTQQTGEIRDVIYVKEFSMFIAIRSLQILTSTDGINWTQRQVIMQAQSLAGLCYIKSLRNMFGGGVVDGQIYTSLDGQSWVIQNNNYLGMFIQNMIYKDGYFYACGYNSIQNIGNIIRSADGEHWEVLYTEENSWLEDIIYINELEKFIVVGSGGVIVTSADGENWISEIQQTVHWNRVTYSKSLGMILVVGSNTNTLRSTDGGTTWIYQKIANVNHNLKGVIFSEELNLFITVGGNYIYKSSDGEIWTSVSLTQYTQYNTVCYSEYEHCFVIVGVLLNNRVIVRSTDGINWFSNIDPNGRTITKIIYSSYYHIFIMVGIDTVLYSTNGINWKTLFGNVKGDFYTVIEKDGKIYIAGGSIYLFKFMQSQETNTENIIANLTTDSDMTMGLDVGSNEVLLGCASGKVSATLSFRQKYIGV